MNYIYWRIIILVLAGIIFGQQISTAQPKLISDNSESETTQDFWNQAQQLIQDRMTIVDQIEKVITGADSHALLVADGQLTLHLLATDRFLKQYSNRPQQVCQSSTPFDSAQGKLSQFSPQQQQVYCSLETSNQDLTKLKPLLSKQLQRLASIAQVSQSSAQSTSNHPVIGRIAKTPRSNDQPVIQPAIAPPKTVAPILQTVKQTIAQTIPAFPTTAKFIYPEEIEQLNYRQNYGLLSNEPNLYAKFLQIPNTGIVRILPAEIYQTPTDTVPNRLSPTVAQRFPFAPLLTSTSTTSSTSEFIPRLALQITDQQFQMVPNNIDYGFMIDLGDVPLENFQTQGASGKSPTSIFGILPDHFQKVTKISSSTLEFFLNYQPPQQLYALEEDRNRFITGKQQFLPQGEILLNQVPAFLNHTYLMRTLQFKLPDFIVTGQPLLSADRRYLSVLLTTPSSDLLLAFRPVNQRVDGSYTVIWRILGKFPDPQIQDLYKYVKFY